MYPGAGDASWFLLLLGFAWNTPLIASLNAPHSVPSSQRDPCGARGEVFCSYLILKPTHTSAGGSARFLTLLGLAWNTPLTMKDSCYSLS